MRTESRLIPPSLCELEDLSDIVSNTSNPHLPKNEFSYALPQDPSESNLPYTHIHIRINGPDGQDHGQFTHFNNIVPSGFTEPSNCEPSSSHCEPKTPSADTITLNGITTGYNSLKDRFDQQEIIEAFKAIDVNKDNLLTKEDIVVFLDYIGEQYEEEEVDEMIAMFNNEESLKGVGIEEFKRLATGEIIGLGNSFMSEKDGNKKSAIYKNVRSTGLKETLIPQNQKPFLDALKYQTINISKFKQQRDKPKIITESKQKKVSKQQYQLERPPYSQQEHLKRRTLFQSVIRVDVETAIINFNEARVGSKITQRQIAKILELPESEIAKLYKDQNQVISKVMIIEVITYSPLRKAERLQLALSVFSSKSTISFNDLLRVLKLMKAHDPKLESKLQTLFRKRGLEGQVSKEFIIQLISEYSPIFLF